MEQTSSMIRCPWCLTPRSVASSAKKQFVRCTSCGHTFHAENNNADNAHDLALGQRNEVRMSKYFRYRENVSVGDIWSIRLVNGKIYLMPDTEGFTLLTSRAGTVFFSAQLLEDTIRRVFGIPDGVGAFFKLLPVQNGYLMQLFTRTLPPSKEKKVAKDKSPTLRVSKTMATHFHVQAMRLLNVMVGDRLLLGFEDGSLYVAKTDMETGYPLTGRKYDDYAQVGMYSFAEQIYDHFALEYRIPHLFQLNPLGVEKEGHLLYKIDLLK